jgi:hypothetical protein
LSFADFARSGIPITFVISAMACTWLLLTGLPSTTLADFERRGIPESVFQ